MASMKPENRRKLIEKSLKDQIKAQGKTDPYYADLIKSYMDLYDLKERCQADIEERGLRYEARGGNGKMIDKPNESCDRIPRIVSAMVGMLDKLGLKDPIRKDDFDDGFS